MHIELLFDGGFKNEEAYGSYRIIAGDYNVIHTVIHGAGYTNNDAEYMTLVHALQYISDNYDPFQCTLVIAGDSELVRNQIGTYTIDHIGTIITGVDINIPVWSGWKTNVRRLRILRDKARALLIRFKSFDYTHIDRTDVVAVLGH